MSTQLLDPNRAATVSERLVDAAAQITTETGWSSVTMAKVAARVGVSRQTVYNELGSKPALGQAVILRELERFLVVVAVDLDEHDDVVTGLRVAIEHVLEMSVEAPLLRAVLASAHTTTGSGGASTGLLPFLTTDAEPLIAASRGLLLEHLADRPPLSDHPDLEEAFDSLVRLVLSHVMHPAADPATTAERVARVGGRLLTP